MCMCYVCACMRACLQCVHSCMCDLENWLLYHNCGKKTGKTGTGARQGCTEIANLPHNATVC